MKQPVLCDMKAFRQALEAGMARHNFTLQEQEKEKLSNFYQLLIEGNNKMNLTALTSPFDVAEKHIADSLHLLPFLPPTGRIADIGSGAGLPGLPLAILRPELSFILIDSLKKRCGFLQETAEALGLKNVLVLNLRAEEAGREPLLRGECQVATARAVARLAVLCEYCLPLLASGGWFYAMKGDKAEAELSESGNALKLLGGSRGPLLEYTLENGEKRSIVSIQKTAHSSKEYPRRPGIPEKNPL